MATSGANDQAQLLHRLLAAWRATRDPALEPLIDKLGALLGALRKPLQGTKLEGAWHDIAKGRDPLDLERLLAAPWPSAAAAIARVRALGAFPPDPRIPLRLATIAAHFLDRESTQVHHAIAAELRRAPSRRVLPLIDAIDAARIARRAGTTRAIYADALAMIHATTVSEADPDLLARGRAATGFSADLDDLWAALVETPDDLALRSVIADRLQAIGEPRGELIALQLAGAPGTARRIAKLLEAHADEWVGGLPGVDPESRVFERGFLTSVHVHLARQPIARSLDHREWATVEALSVVGDSTTDVAALVARMPLLRRFAGPPWAIEQLATTAAAQAIETLIVDDDYLPSAKVFHGLRVVLARKRWSSSATSIGALAELGLHAAGYLEADLEIVPATLRATRNRRSMELRFSFSPISTSTIPGWQLRIPAGHELAHLQYGGHPARTDVVPILEMLDRAGVRRISIARRDARTNPRWHQLSNLVLEDGPAFDLLATS